jgi:hypothetical protein
LHTIEKALIQLKDTLFDFYNPGIAKFIDILKSGAPLAQIAEANQVLVPYLVIVGYNGRVYNKYKQNKEVTSNIWFYKRFNKPTEVGTDIQI